MRDCSPSSISMIHTMSSPSLRASLGHDYFKRHLPDEGNFFLHGLPRSGFLSTNCLDSLLIIDTQVLLCSVVTQFFEMSTIST